MTVKRIKFERTGGFAGIRFAADFELDDLPEDQAHQILELLDDVDFDELPEHITSDHQVADGFFYSLTVESDERARTVTTDEPSAPEKMARLFEILTQVAREQARNKK